MALPAEEKRFSFAEMMEWPEEDGRYELTAGVPILMAPPTTEHQRVCMELCRQLGNFLEGKKCAAFPAPFGVRLFEEDGDTPEDVYDVVEPDITVVCDRSKLDDHGCKGAPDMVIEILSPSTRRRDRLDKLALYQRAGVPEYWIVNPEDQTVQVLLLEEGRLTLREDYGRKDIAKVNALEGCFIELYKVFPERSK